MQLQVLVLFVGLGLLSRASAQDVAVQGCLPLHDGCYNQDMDWDDVCGRKVKGGDGEIDYTVICKLFPYLCSVAPIICGLIDVTEDIPHINSCYNNTDDISLLMRCHGRRFKLEQLCLWGQSPWLCKLLPNALCKCVPFICRNSLEVGEDGGSVGRSSGAPDECTKPFGKLADKGLIKFDWKHLCEPDNHLICEDFPDLCECHRLKCAVLQSQEAPTQAVGRSGGTSSLYGPDQVKSISIPTNLVCEQGCGKFCQLVPEQCDFCKIVCPAIWPPVTGRSSVQGMVSSFVVSGTSVSCKLCDLVCWWPMGGSLPCIACKALNCVDVV